MTREEFINRVLKLGYSVDEVNDKIKSLEEDAEMIASYGHETKEDILTGLFEMGIIPKLVY